MSINAFISRFFQTRDELSLRNVRGGLWPVLGYIIIYYLCGGAIKKSRSLKMFRLYCLVFFVEYFGISGLFAHAFDTFAWPNH